MLRNNEPVAVTPPAANFVLVAKRQLTLGGTVYPCGAEVPVTALSRNYQSLIDSRYVCWQPPSDKPRPSARELPPAAPPLVNPPVEIVADADVVQSWRRTLALMTERCGGSRQRAEDLLFSNAEVRSLYLVAQRTACTREAERRGRSVTPNEAGI